MAVLRETPYAEFNFLVDLGTGNAKGPDAGFSEIALPDVSVDIFAYRNGNDPENAARLVAGNVHYSTITLKRGQIGSLSLYQWFDQVRKGDPAAKMNIAIQLLSEDRAEVVVTWKLSRALPAKYTFSNLDALGREVAVEALELAFEQLEME